MQDRAHKRPRIKGRFIKLPPGATVEGDAVCFGDSAPLTRTPSTLAVVNVVGEDMTENGEGEVGEVNLDHHDMDILPHMGPGAGAALLHRGVMDRHHDDDDGRNMGDMRMDMSLSHPAASSAPATTRGGAMSSTDADADAELSEDDNPGHHHAPGHNGGEVQSNSQLLHTSCLPCSCRDHCTCCVFFVSCSVEYRICGCSGWVNQVTWIAHI